MIARGLCVSAVVLGKGDRSRLVFFYRLAGVRPAPATILGCFCALVVLAGASASSALAGVTHPFAFGFGGTATPTGSFGGVDGVAIDQANHRVYVKDFFGATDGTDAVDVFSEAGTYLSQITGAATPQGGFSFAFPGALAVDNTETSTKGRVYVVDENHGVVDAFSPTGAYVYQLDGSTTPAGSLGAPRGVAVDASGDVYVSDSEHGVIDKFSAAGSYLSQISSPEISQPGSLAVDASGDLYVVNAQSTLVELNPFGQAQAVIDSNSPVAVSLDPVTGNVYVAHEGSLSEYDPLGALVSSFGASFLSRVAGVAVDGATEDVFVPDPGHAEVLVFGPAAPAPDVVTGAASAVGGSVATLNGTVNPASNTLPASYQFQYGTSTAYGEVAPAAPVSLGTGTTALPQSVTVPGLQPNTTYHYRIVASNSNGPVEGADATFTTSGPPAVEAESASQVTTTGATLQASIDPHGRDTHYYFQYGTDQSYSAGQVPAAPGADIGSGMGVEAVSQSITGLQPGTTYHYRVLAVSSEATVPGLDHTFSTFPETAPGLPDNRSYELVSPADKEDGGVYSVGGFSTPGHQATFKQPFQSATNGDAVTYSGDSSAQGNGLLGNEYLATRGTAGWSAKDITPPTAGPGPQCPHPLITTAPFAAFSADLTVGVLAAVTTPALPVGAGPCYVSVFARNNTDGTYQALTNSQPGHRSAREFGFGLPEEGDAPQASYMFAGASSDFTRLFFAANDALTPDAVDGGKTGNNLYESAGGQLRLINVLPDGTSQPDATFGTTLESGEPPNYTHAVSSDGSHVYWTDLDTNNPSARTGLFLGGGGAPSVQVDLPQGGSGLGGGGKFLTATPSGSKVFFSDGAFAKLTSDSMAGSGPNLYEYDAASGKLRDITGEQAEAGVLGVVGASDDGAYVYFVAEGQLTPGAPEGTNMYLAHPGAPGEQLTFVAAMSPEDNSDSQGGDTDAPQGDWRGDLGYNTARVTPDGQHLVFQSLDSGPANAGQTEVYLYNVGAAAPVCVSCNPTGLAPSGPSVLHPSETDGFQPRWISDDGRQVFFDSKDALTLGDTNGTWDVYEYENGQVHLISGGRSANGSYFDDATADGGNVFFTTREQLVPQDKDELTDLYDARVGGGFPSVPAGVPCAGEGCRPAQGTSPVLPTAASATFGGFTEASPVTDRAKAVKVKVLSRKQKLAKALKACGAKHKRQRRARCEAQVKKRYGPVKRTRTTKRRSTRGKVSK